MKHSSIQRIHLELRLEEEKWTCDSVVRLLEDVSYYFNAVST